MTMINSPATNNQVLSLRAVAEETTTQPPLPTGGDLVAKAIAIVKRSAEDRNFDQIDEPLKQLVTLMSGESITRVLSRLVLEVKNTQATADFAVIYQHLVEDFQVDDPFLIENFSDSPEEFRIACAKRQAKQKTLDLCQNIKKYAISSQAALIEIAKIAAEDNSRATPLYVRDADENAGFSLYIADFGIESEDARIEIAKIAAKYEAEFSKNVDAYGITREDMRRELAEIAIKNDDETFCANIDKFQITNQESLKRFVDLILEQPNSIKTFCECVDRFGIQDAHFRLQTVRRILANPVNSVENFRIICRNIDRFSITDQDQLIQWAKLAAETIGDCLSYNMLNFNIQSQQALLEIALIAFDKFGSSIPLNEINNFKLDLHSRAILYCTIQNSVRCRRVLDFSARNTGPKQYVLPKAAAVASP